MQPIPRQPAPPEPGATRDRPAAVVPDAAIDMRSVALALVCVVALLGALRLGRDIFVPFALGILGSYALEPVVRALLRVRVPRALGAALIVLAVVAAGAGTVYALADGAVAILERLPQAVQKVRTATHALRRSDGPLGKVEQLATEIEKSAAVGAPGAPAPQGVTRVQVEEKPLDVRGYLVRGSVGLMSGASQLVLMLFLVYFLLASGDLYKRKLVRLAGPSLQRRRITVEVLNEIDASVQHFLWIQMVTSGAVGLASWVAFRAFGLEDAAVWAIAAGVLNAIPYVGGIIVVVGVALLGFLQFGTVGMALLVAGVASAINALEGFVLTPMLVGRACRMNDVAVFASLLLLGWMWGAAGMLLAVPLMTALKAVCDRVEDLKPVGELLGDG